MLRLSSGLQNALLGSTGGGSFQELLEGGVLRLFSGSQPASCDESEGAAVLLAEITLSGATFTPGATSVNGLTFDDPVLGVLAKAVAEVWQGAGVADGNAGWFRFYNSNRVVGGSSSAVRFDGAVATSGGEISMSNTVISVGTPVIINTFTVSLPKS